MHRLLKDFLGRSRWPAIGVGVTVLAGTVFALAGGDDDDDGDDDYDALPGRTEEQIDALIFNFDEVVETIAIYASLMSVLIILLMLALALRLKSWAAYIGLAVLSMIWFALFEQVYTGLYWVGLNVGYGPLVIAGFALASLHAVQAGLSIAPERQFGWARPIFFVLAIGFWGILALNWPIVDLPPSFMAVAAIAVFGHLLAVPSFFSTQSVTVKVDRTGLIFVVIIALTVLAFVLFGEIAEGFDLVFLGRLVLFSVVAFFSVFLVRHAIVLLWDRDARILKELEASRRDAEQSRILLETEQKYSRARDAAQTHILRLATASHDIRQPIGSLKSAVATLTRDQPKDVGDQLNAALDYLDKLAESYVDQEEQGATDQTPAATETNAEETVESEMICATLDRMFRKEAEQKGLRFDATAQPSHLKTDPLAVMRILSNLLSNAIKHTPEGRISLSGQRHDDGYVYTIYNSANLPEQLDQDRLFDPYEKGAESTGTGLGLSIVDSLTTKAGLHLAWSSPAGEGTTFNLSIALNPAAPEMQ